VRRVLPCRRTTPSWPLLRPAAAAAAAATITTAASAIADADSAPGLCLRHRHLPPPEARHRRPLATTSIAVGAVSTISSDVMAAKSTAAASATLLFQLHKVGRSGAARSI